jgi:hypothetical protein
MQQQDIVVRLLAPEVQSEDDLLGGPPSEPEPDLLATSLASAQSLQSKVEQAFLATKP